MGGVVAERVGRIVERKLERVGRIYPLELKVSKLNTARYRCKRG